MKRIIISILLTALAAAEMSAQRVLERTYIATDKSAYVAGDRIWCSAFCFSLESEKLSGVSSIAYVELLSPDGDIMQTAKIAMEGGRGSGYLNLPESMPTGNYRLISFTTANKNEKDYDYLCNSKVISVFNSKLASKLKDKVEIVSDRLYEEKSSGLSEESQSGDVSISIPSGIRSGRTFDFSISNNGAKPLSLSVSVYKEDGIVPPENKHIESISLPSAQEISYEETFPIEKEGEIILASLSGKDRDNIIAHEFYATGYISTSGNSGDTYTSSIGEDGTMKFSTSNIFGSRELVTEVADLDNEDYVGLIDIESPFVSVKSETPMLAISEKVGKAVVDRGRAMQEFKMEYADSLAEFYGRKEDFPYDMSNAVVYNLDDYTRFPTVREVLVEITPDVRVRGRGNKQRIQVLTKDLDESVSTLGSSWETSLVLLDGVPVFKHKDMMDYDAMLLASIHVWREKYLFGNKTYYGIVNFISKKGNMAFMDFGSNVRIVDFQGACYPMEYTRRFTKPGEEDLRGTILWKPEMEIGAGQKTEIKCYTPDSAGNFTIVVEGVDTDGQIIYKKTTFAVGE